MEESLSERLVKSADRVRDLGEVFTPSRIVKDMLDLLPEAMWRVNPSRTFLEPACGDGNFLVEIYRRKAAAVAKSWGKGDLPAGKEPDALRFHLLEAMSSIYGVDISPENILGGTPEHPVGARERLELCFSESLREAVGQAPRTNSLTVQSLRWVLDRNIQIANMLSTNSDGTPNHYREDLPLIDYGWSPTELKVRVSLTTLGDTMRQAEQESAEAPSLFGAAEPEVLWEGRFDEVHRAPAPTEASAGSLPGGQR